MRYFIQRGGRAGPAWRFVVLLAALGLTTACRGDDPLPTGPRVATPSGPLVAIVGANVTSLPFVGFAINDAGQVAGTQNPGEGAGQPPPRAMLYTPGVGVQDLGTLGGTKSAAFAINEQGQVVGYSTTATGARHAFLWTPGAGMRDLGVLADGLGSVARGINDRGEVVGESTLPIPAIPRNPETHAFLWTPTSGMQDLGALGGELTSSVAYDINNAGQVVGRSYSADRIIPPDPGSDLEYYSRAFLWAPGQGMKDLGALESGYAVAYAINDAGLIVGKSWVSRVLSEDYGYSGRPVLWAPGQTIRDLGGLRDGAHNSAAYGINEAGLIVGSSDFGRFPENAPVEAFLWSATDGVESLYPTTGLTTAQGINNHQQVVGDRSIATLHIVPGNDHPVAITGGPYTGTEGTPVDFDVSAEDDSDVGLTYTVSYGDGATDVRPTASGFTHRYADNGTYTLTLTVRDAKGASDTKTTTVTIANVAPAILAGSLTGPTAPIALAGGRASAPISFEFNDMGGKHDAYTATVACGNGVALTAHDIPVEETSAANGTYTGGRGTYRGACTYTSGGLYTVSARVSDEDGGTSGEALFSPVIIVDPAASTKGSGFYSVPGQGNRKAHFTFAASFPGGGTVPNGSVRLWVPGGEMNFEGSAIELLVVSGNQAQFWGTGRLNGAPARFRITAVDGNAHHDGVADAIRVELWDASGALRYDSQPGTTRDAAVTTPLSGGNIQIRRG
ncbi:MAG TPA: PKD domain-containing protein [Gemmatimonadaceae bacterium]|nr:PKD domain-containing protein [Gemmatimonadaceae bacterium]